MLRKATRLEKIPPYLFMELRNKINKAKAAGVDVISLAIGDPVEPTPGPIIEELCRAAHDPANHRYPTDEEKGMAALRREVCRWYAERYAAPVDPETECLILIGSKEGCHHFALAMVNPGDTVLVTDPGYPGYKPSIWFAGAEPYPVPMTAENGFLPDLGKIPADVARKAKAFYLNYPNNPTGAVATPEFLTKLVAFAREHSIAICYDNPYIDIVFDGARPLSILSIEGAKEVAVELNSFSKPFNMTGWRLGHGAGEPDRHRGHGAGQVEHRQRRVQRDAICRHRRAQAVRAGGGPDAPHLRAPAQAGGGYAELPRLEVRAAEGHFLSLGADAGRQEFGGVRGAAFRAGAHRRRARAARMGNSAKATSGSPSRSPTIAWKRPWNVSGMHLAESFGRLAAGARHLGAGAGRPGLSAGLHRLRSRPGRLRRFLSLRRLPGRPAADRRVAMPALRRRTRTLRRRQGRLPQLRPAKARFSAAPPPYAAMRTWPAR